MSRKIYRKNASYSVVTHTHARTHERTRHDVNLFKIIKESTEL